LAIDFKTINNIVKLEALGTIFDNSDISELEAKVIWNIRFVDIYNTGILPFDTEEEIQLVKKSENSNFPAILSIIESKLGLEFLRGDYNWRGRNDISFESYLINFIDYLYYRFKLKTKFFSEYNQFINESESINSKNIRIPTNKYIMSLFFKYQDLGNHVSKMTNTQVHKLLSYYITQENNNISNYSIDNSLIEEWAKLKLEDDEFNLLTHVLIQALSKKGLLGKYNLKNKRDLHFALSSIDKYFPNYSKYINNPIIKDIDISLTGWVRTQIGIGEDVRVASKSFESNDIPYVITDAALTIAPSPKQVDLGFEDKISNTNNEKVEIIFLDAATLFKYNSKKKLNNNYNDSTKIAVSPWELPEWPKEASYVLNDIDYFWAATNYIKKAFQSIIPEDKIFLAPPAVHINEKYLDKFDVRTVKGTFKFLTTFDGLSSVSRKNPLATVKAFKKAFQSNEDVELVIKTMNFNESNEELDKIRNAIRDDNRISVINEKLTIEDLFNLIKSTHCFVSLHRSEGFGRNIAESMIFKRPVIVSNFSGNTDFCFDNNSYLVDGKMIDVKQGEYWYSKGQKWFDACINSASEQMYNVYSNREVAYRKAQNAFNYMTSFHSIEETGVRYKSLLNNTIYKENLID